MVRVSCGGSFEPQERYILKWLKNLQLGHSYTWQASAVVDDVLKQQPLTISNRRNYYLAVGASGVGQGLADVLQCNHRLPLRRVVIHGGRNEFFDEDKREWHVPRNSLILDLQVALEEPGRTLLIDESVTNRGQLVEEASNLKPDVTAAGRERIGFFKEEVHDDRVFAFAIAYWLARKVLRPPGLKHNTNHSTRNLPFKAPAQAPFSARDFVGW